MCQTRVLLSFLILCLIHIDPSRADDISHHPCAGTAYETAKRLAGVWKEFTVTDQGEVFLGTLTSRLELGGCVFSQSFESADGSFSFRSFGHIDPQTKNWSETFVFDNGRIASYLWRTEGNDVIIDQKGEDAENLRRLRITSLSSDSYDVWEEHSKDQGNSWQKVEWTHTRRVE